MTWFQSKGIKNYQVWGRFFPRQLRSRGYVLGLYVACSAYIFSTVPVFRLIVMRYDLIEVSSGHALEARMIGDIYRVHGAVLVNARLARCEPVFLDRLELGVLGIFAVVLALAMRSDVLFAFRSSRKRLPRWSANFGKADRGGTGATRAVAI